MIKEPQNTIDKLELYITCSGPRPMIEDDWQCISYTVQLRKGPKEGEKSIKPIWEGEYKLGIGHAQPKKSQTESLGMSNNQKSMYECWARNLSANFEDKQLQTEVACILARKRKLVPSCSDVLYSLLMEGEAYFSGEQFEDWASNFGYDSDSRKAEAIWKECDSTGRKLKYAFSDDQLEQLRTAFQDY